MANYYRMLLPRLQVRSDSFVLDHLEMPIGGKGRFAVVRQLVEWLTFAARFIVYMIVRRPVLTVFNPSLTRFCLFRDGFFMSVKNLLHPGGRTLVFFRGWNLSNERHLTGRPLRHLTSSLLRADVVLSLTAHSQRILSSLKPPSTRLMKFHTLVDPDLQQFLEDNPDLEKGKDSFLFLGNVDEAKGVFELLAAFREFVKQRPRARLQIFGQGAAHADVLTFIQTHGLQHNIEAPGPIQGVDKFRRIARAEVFLLPSYTEGMPNAVLEALAARCLVVGTPVGGMAEMIERGWVCPIEVRSAKSILLVLEDIDRMRDQFDTAAIARTVVAQYGLETTAAFFENQFHQAAN